MADVFWIVVLVLAALGAVAVGYTVWRSRERHGREELRRRFGSEYERAVEETGSGQAARRELRHRIRRVERLHLRDLDPEERARFREAWEDIQARFVDDPTRAANESDRLLEIVTRARGYTAESFDENVADLSVHHASLIPQYLDAHALTKGAASGRATTEDLRRALVCYRALFADLVEGPRPAAAHPSAQPARSYE